jgi:hypothetical protein
MLRTLRMVHRPRPDAMPGGGLDAPPGMAFFAPSFSEVDVGGGAGGGAGVARALRHSPPIGDERSEREVAGPRAREVGVGGRKVIVDA